MAGILDLPEEILEQIFLLLSLHQLFIIREARELLLPPLWRAVARQRLHQVEEGSMPW